MNQRFTLDRKSFEQFLAAISFLQQLKKQAAHKRALTDPNQPLASLLQLQRAINSGTADMDSAMSAVVKLAQSAIGANSAGVWLFRTDEEFCCCARIGAIYDPERLGMEVLAQLATSNPCDPDSAAFSRSLKKASRYPGYPNSIAIAALRIGGKVAGALAAFSVEFDAFAPRDLDNLRLIASLFEQAIQKAMQSGYQEAVALEHSAMLRLLEGILPRLNELEKQLRSSAYAPVAEPGEEYPELADETEPDRHPPVFTGVAPIEAAEAQMPAAGDEERSDISVPGIGVRAALGDVREYSGDSEPFFLWQALGHGRARVVALATHCRSEISRVYGAALIRARNSAVFFAALPGQVWRHRPSLPKPEISALVARTRNSIARYTNQLLLHLPHFHRPALPRIEFAWARNLSVHLQSLSRSSLQLGKMLLNQANNRLRYGLRLARVQARSLRRSARQANADITAFLTHTRITVRITSRRQKRVLASSAEVTESALHRASESLAGTVAYAGRSTMAALQAAHAWISTMTRGDFNRASLRRSAGAVIVLAIMALFLGLQTTLRGSFHSEPVSAASTSSTSSVPASSHLAEAQTTAVRLPPGPTSHLEITDNGVADALHDLTRYEVATLQRSAEYGDDEAAFQLGMAYETGYYVRQNCSKAAHWVKLAADGGNVAAAYNLALRYGNGDGLPADPAAAALWLKIAAAHKYSPAKLASDE